MQVVCITQVRYNLFVMRTNIYKNKIVTLLERAHLLSIAQITEQITEADFSTIFRNIEQLRAEGIVRKIVVSKEITWYELIKKNNHDHFICNTCGTVESVHFTKPSTLQNRTVITDVVARGICNNCIQ